MQEEGNIPWVIDNKVGAFSEDPLVIAGLIKKWFGPKSGELQVGSLVYSFMPTPHRLSYNNQFVDSITFQCIFVNCIMDR